MRKLSYIFLLVAAFLLLSGQQMLQTISTAPPPVASGSFGTARNYGSGSCANATTCAVPSVTLNAGELVIIMARVLGVVRITGTDVAGTTVDCGLISTTQINRSAIRCAYITSASAVSNATVTVQFSGSTGGAIVSLRAYPYSGGTPSIDAIADLAANSGLTSGSITGPSNLTLTGTNDIVYEAASAFDSGGSSHNVTAVDGSWTNTYFSAAGFADQVNVASVSTPTWTTTASETIKATTAMAWGFSPTSCVGYGLQDFSGGTNGVTPTDATLATGQFGLLNWTSPRVTGGVAPYWSLANGTALTYATGAHHALNGAAPRFCWSGTTYSDAGSLGLALDTTTCAASNCVLTWHVPWESSGTVGVVSFLPTTAVVFFRTNQATGDNVNTVVLQVHTPTSGEFGDIIVHNTGGVCRFELEGSASTPITFTCGNGTTFGSWYQLSVKSDPASGVVAQIWSEDGSTQIGSDLTLTYATTPSYVDTIDIGKIDTTTITGGRTFQFDKLKMCVLPPSGSCPWPFKE